MRDYYSEVGAPEEATRDELRQAYRRRARELHPDVNRDGRADEDMGRLNEAWRVLGNARARRRYDEARGHGAIAEGAVDEEEWGAPVPAAHRVRPTLWLAVLGVLAVMLVVTAYAAGPAPVTPVSPPQPDRCLARLPGYDAFVSCSQPNVGRVVAELPGTSPVTCPAGSTPQPFLGRAETVCLEANR